MKTNLVRDCWSFKKPNDLSPSLKRRDANMICDILNMKLKGGKGGRYIGVK